MTNRIIRRLIAIRRAGLLQTLRIAKDRLFLKCLGLAFGFDAWHAEAPTSARPYREDAARIVNELNPLTVVEVACGLGEILSFIQSPHRYGFDIDQGVIKAARLLRGRNIEFQVGSCDAVHLDKFDALILVNWIHEISPESLEACLVPLLPRIKYLLLDAIDADGSVGYRFKHDFSFLKDSAKLLSITRPRNEGRSFQLFEISK